LRRWPAGGAGFALALTNLSRRIGVVGAVLKKVREARRRVAALTALFEGDPGSAFLSGLGCHPGMHRGKLGL